jgi:hypothetical protein
MAIGKLARMIPTMVKGVKMMDSGSSEQEARSYMESQGLRNIQIKTYGCRRICRWNEKKI